MKTPRQDSDRDLGLGSRLTETRGVRFLNPDGSFNVRRKGQSILESLNVFHWLLNISVGQFMLLVGALYTMVNATFAFGYFLCGRASFVGASATRPAARFL